MRLGTIAFLLGCLLAQQMAILPDIRLSISFLILVGLALCLQYRFRQSLAMTALRFLLLVSCGLLWASIYAGGVLSHSLAEKHEGIELQVDGEVVNLPITTEQYHRFNFHTNIENKSYLVRLNWYTRGNNQPRQLPKAGERWRLRIKLKKPNGYANPGGVDFEQNLFRQGINATGYVRPSKINERLLSASQNPTASAVLLFRAVLAENITAAIATQSHHGIVSALALGDRRSIKSQEWQVFSRTGTNHLIAISGLHIGLVAGLIFFIARFGLSIVPGLAARVAVQIPAAYLAMASAFFYALLAGFTIPTQRALIMISIVMLGIIFRRQFSVSNILALALLLVIIYDPLSVLDIGFWLSFCAVAVIAFAVTGRLKTKNRFWQWSQVQVIIVFGMLPLILLLFQRLSIISPIANSLAIPWISFITVPLSLLGSSLLSLLPSIGEELLILAVKSVQLLWWFLDACSQLPFAVWQTHSPQQWTLLPAGLGIIWLLLPKGIPARWIGMFWLLPLLLLPRSGPSPGQVRLTLLDVGQGLAVLVQTQHHALLYDTGPAFSADFDTGRAVILPYLSYYGIDTIDTLIVSHGDNDHRGGANSVVAGTKVVNIVTGARPSRWFHPRAKSCLRGEHWHWDGVTFSFLHPQHNRIVKNNNRSCVLRIDTGSQSILLTGDIERAAEQELVRDYQQQLQSTVLVAPHHGSKSSSSLVLLQAVAPELILVANGYRNRYGFPHQQVIERYRQFGIPYYETAKAGALSITLEDGQPLRVESWRQSHQRYWQRKTIPE